jgi:hypothetical protein
MTNPAGGETVMAGASAGVTGATVSASGNIDGGNLRTAGLISATGNITGGNILGGANVNATTHTGTTVSVTANITGGNILTGGLISATGNITGGNLITAGLLSIGGGSQAASYSASGNVTGGNLLTGGLISATGNINGGNILGGANVNATTHTGTTVSVTANITGGNVLTGGLISATGNINGGNVTATTGLTAGTLSLTGNTISSTDAIITIDPASAGSSGAVIIQGNLSVTGNVTYINSNNVTTNDLTINVANNAATAAAANGGGIEVGPAGAQYASILYNSTSNTWVVSNGANISGAVSVSGNITGGNVLGGANVNATTHTGTTVSVTGNVDAGNLRTGGLVSATGAITGGAITGSSLTVSTGSVTAGNIVNANGNGVGNIGSSSVYFNTVFAKATSAQYADLAENYRADAAYEPGTVLEFGGDEEVTISITDSSKRVAGVVSTNPAYLMNAGLSGTHVAAVALTGRVPVKVEGPVAKGDLMVSNGNGRARACINAVPVVGTILGKSLENFTGGEGTIEVVIGKQ